MTVGAASGTGEDSGDVGEGVNPLSKKLKRILDTKFETDKAVLESLKMLSDFYGDNTLQNRRNLRRDIESQNLDVNRNFLNNFRGIKEKFVTVADTISGMNKCCDDMSKRLQESKSKTRDLINETTKLQGENRKIETKLELVNAFLATFQLKPDEAAALKETPSGSLHQDFSKSLKRLKQIHGDCKLLVRSTHQRAGLEIMEQTAAQMEDAYGVLYRWIQRECRLFNVDSLDVNPVLCDAVSQLQDRPILLKYSLDEFCTARRNSIVRSFIDALTHGGPSGVPRAMELLSHDPLRYVGDMLAWIHQTLASEHEHLQALLKQCSEEMSAEMFPHCMAHITDGLCRPFKVRVEQVLSGENGPVVLYKLNNILGFYIETVGQVMDANSGLIGVMSELRELTENLFFSSLGHHISRMLTKIEVPGPELTPVTGLHQIILLLRDVLESHDSTLVPSKDKQKNFQRIFGSVIDPLIQSLMLSSTNLHTVDVAIYMINSLHAVHSTLSLFEYTDKRLEMIQAQIDVHCDVLVSEQAGYILQRTDMTSVYNSCLQHKHGKDPLASVVGCDSVSIKSALNKFELYLGSPDSYRLPQCQLLTSMAIRNDVHKRTVDAICAAYGEIYTAVHKEGNHYVDAHNIASKSVDVIRNLLV